MNQYEQDLAGIQQAIAELTEGQQRAVAVAADEIRAICESSPIALCALALVGAEYAAKPEVQP
jgi:hypothetical protein